MKLAHLADLHLGFRQFDKTNRAGANQREADVAEAFKRAVDGVLAAQPDVVLIAGDLFHAVRPPNSAILAMFAQLQRLRGVPVLAVSGNHDTPRSAETASILGLYRALGVQLAQGQVERFVLDGLTVTAVPSAAARTVGTLDPVPGTRNVLLLHAAIPKEIEVSALDRGWDYCALGDYHVAHQVGPRAWYAGSLDYVATNAWGELAEEAERGLPGKGWLLVELGEGEPVVTFQPIEPPRRVLSLPAIDATNLGAADIDAALAATLGAVELAGAWARLVVENVSLITKRSIDHQALRRLKAAALNLQIEWRRPAAEAPTVAARAVRMRRLDQIVDAFLGDRQLPEDVDRDRLRALGQQYVEQAAGAEDPYSGLPVQGVA